MPRLVICSRNSHWHWINRTLLCDIIEVSKLRLAWLTIVCSNPHWQVGWSWFHKKLSPVNREQRLSRWANFVKNCLPWIGSKVLPWFRKKYSALGRQKMWSIMGPRYIQFRNIHDCDISGVHCKKKWKSCSPLYKCQTYKQLSFQTWFPKNGPTYRRQVVNPWHQTLQGQSVAKPGTPL